MSSESKENNKILHEEGERLKKEIKPKLYDELIDN